MSLQKAEAEDDAEVRLPRSISRRIVYLSFANVLPVTDMNI